MKWVIAGAPYSPQKLELELLVTPFVIFRSLDFRLIIYSTLSLSSNDPFPSPSSPVQSASTSPDYALGTPCRT